MKTTIKNVIKPALSFVRHQQSKRIVGNILKKKDRIFLDVGSGSKKGSNGWLTIDLVKNCDIYWDLRKGLPFPDESISKIYSSHFFEHLTFEEGQIFLDECMRVLLPKGNFSICVPNSRIYIEPYLDNSELDKDTFFGWKPAYNGTTKIDYINYIAYMDGHHKYMFDEQNLVHILQSKGMKKVTLRGFDPSLDMPERDFNSIYAEAEK